MTFSAPNLFGEAQLLHQSQLPPAANKFHVGNGDDGKHYWLTPWTDPEFVALAAEFGPFDFDPCPYPLPECFDGLTCEWGQNNYLNIPFGSIMHQGPGDKKPKKKGPTAWVRKAIEESRKGKRVVMVYPVDKWLLMLLSEILGEHAQVRNLGDVKWLATEDNSRGKGTGRHIACFILEPMKKGSDDAPPVDPRCYRTTGPSPSAPQPHTSVAVSVQAIAAGTQRAETSETSAPSEGCQSGPKGIAPNTPPNHPRST